MNDMDYSDVLQMLKVADGFRCERYDLEDGIGRFKCKGCDYLYKTVFGSYWCLKSNIRDWALYRIERGKV